VYITDQILFHDFDKFANNCVMTPEYSYAQPHALDKPSVT
jgi:hypothetical protein